MSAKEPERQFERFTLDWQGIALSVSYEEHWLGVEHVSPFATAHFEVRVIDPDNHIIPITETSYRSHFVHRDVVRKFGGPADFVIAWLEEAAQSPEWKARLDRHRQFSLF
ncbi:hypothetical protein [Maricaulis sp.]|uniref:hypothetical protein n=1 Tax=Maricaulis sp. TaxID=1486257 RepID=UPI0026226164|nr:hypothetical protein [Maricaulis sp.]